MNNNTRRFNESDVAMVYEFLLDSYRQNSQYNINESEELEGMEETEEMEEEFDLLESQRVRMVEDMLLDLQSAIVQFQSTITIHNGAQVLRDFQYVCYLGSPVHFIQEATNTRVNGNSYNWWSVRHPNLHDGTGPDSFRAHYRINRATFDFIVDVLKDDTEFKVSNERDGTTSHPVWKQVAIVLWRLSNTHIGFRIAEAMLGVSQASYHRFTMRFLNAMIRCLYQHSIRWPSTVVESRAIMAGFARPSRNTGLEHLKECIGAIDGKLVSIQKPSVFGNSWLDRHGNASMALMAICDHKKRFIRIRTGIPGK